MELIGCHDNTADSLLTKVHGNSEQIGHHPLMLILHPLFQILQLPHVLNLGILYFFLQDASLGDFLRMEEMVLYHELILLLLH